MSSDYVRSKAFAMADACFTVRDGRPASTTIGRAIGSLVGDALDDACFGWINAPLATSDSDSAGSSAWEWTARPSVAPRTPEARPPHLVAAVRHDTPAVTALQQVRRHPLPRGCRGLAVTPPGPVQRPGSPAAADRRPSPDEVQASGLSSSNRPYRFLSGRVAEALWA